MIKYPIYIISKGRWENPITAKMFLKEKVPFQIFVEPQEYQNYCDTLGPEVVEALPFKNLGLGSYPARNHVWEHSLKEGHKRHWVFDDNIYGVKRLYKGKRIACDVLPSIEVLEEFTDRYLNIGVSGFNYRTFVTKTTRRPFVVNAHVYSAMLIKNNLPFRWRLKYNEDVDLCLQILNTKKLCTILFSAFMIDKVSTAAKMKGGNQDELYKNNSYKKKVLKARSLEVLWPRYVKTVWRFNRPHHQVNWKKLFTQNLLRDPNIDWEALKKSKGVQFELKTLNPVKSTNLKKIVGDYNKE